jgi:hypothetical protein
VVGHRNRQPLFLLSGGQPPGSDGDMVPNQALSDLRKEFVENSDEISK